MKQKPVKNLCLCFSSDLINFLIKFSFVLLDSRVEASLPQTSKDPMVTKNTKKLNNSQACPSVHELLLELFADMLDLTHLSKETYAYYYCIVA